LNLFRRTRGVSADGGIAAAPEEPTLRLLLGHVYDGTGLTQLAATEFDEGEALTASRN
jgi:hypothetical protein